MDKLPLNEPAGVLVKTTCVDYPGILAGSFFLKGCNLRCPYCYNTGLVLGKNSSSSEPLSTIEELFAHLEKRQGILRGLVISGGEPLINPYTPIIIKKAKELGYLIKLDTNGTLPDQLEAFINNPELKPDFIAMDFKTTPSKYGTLLGKKNNSGNIKGEYFETILKRSIQLVQSYPPENREWRTVLAPPLVTKEDIEKMAAFLPDDASWQFAQFQKGNCIDPEYNDIYPYTDKEAAELMAFAKELKSGANLR